MIKNNNSFLRKSKAKHLFLLLILTPIINIGGHLLHFYLEQWQVFSHLSASLVLAQSLRPNQVSTQVYQQIPDLPQENNYISVETQTTAVENTLINRLIRYHQYVKARPTIFRLDWKLTLADYLGKNEGINEQRYPGYSSLTQNPLEADKKAIASLTRQQRDNLVNILVGIYNPNSNQNTDSVSPDESQSSTEVEDDNPSFELPLPGGADLLKP